MKSYPQFAIITMLAVGISPIMEGVDQKLKGVGPPPEHRESRFPDPNPPILGIHGTSGNSTGYTGYTGYWSEPSNTNKNSTS